MKVNKYLMTLVCMSIISLFLGTALIPASTQIQGNVRKITVPLENTDYLDALGSESASGGIYIDPWIRPGSLFFMDCKNQAFKNNWNRPNWGDGYGNDHVSIYLGKGDVERNIVSAGSGASLALKGNVKQAVSNEYIFTPNDSGKHMFVEALGSNNIDGSIYSKNPNGVQYNDISFYKWATNPSFGYVVDDKKRRLGEDEINNAIEWALGEIVPTVIEPDSWDANGNPLYINNDPLGQIVPVQENYQVFFEPPHYGLKHRKSSGQNYQDMSNISQLLNACFQRAPKEWYCAELAWAAYYNCYDPIECVKVGIDIDSTEWRKPWRELPLMQRYLWYSKGRWVTPQAIMDDYNIVMYDEEFHLEKFGGDDNNDDNNDVGYIDPETDEPVNFNYDITIVDPKAHDYFGHFYDMNVYLDEENLEIESMKKVDKCYTTFDMTFNEPGTYKIKVDAQTVPGHEPWGHYQTVIEWTVNITGGNQSCFLENTKIEMADNSLKNIQDIQVGDMVQSYDTDDNEWKTGIVSEVFHHSPEEMADYYLIINDDLRVTPNHPIYLDGKWSTAGELQPGDVFGGNVITSMEKVYQRIPTFNFEVTPYHTYNVVWGENNIASVVHNANDDIKTGPIETVKKKNPSGDKSSCFLEDTKVEMTDGTLKDIEDIQVGDMVKSYDEATQTLKDGIVTEVFHHTPKEMMEYYLVINDDLRVTPNHLLYVNDRWIEADEITVDDIIGVGQGVMVTSVKRIHSQVPTYNLEVEPYHTYNVVFNDVNDELIVHNAFKEHEGKIVGAVPAKKLSSEGTSESSSSSFSSSNTYGNSASNNNIITNTITSLSENININTNTATLESQVTSTCPVFIRKTAAMSTQTTSSSQSSSTSQKTIAGPVYIKDSATNSATSITQTITAPTTIATSNIGIGGVSSETTTLSETVELTASKNIAGSTIEIPTAPKSSSSTETSLSKSTNSLTSETSNTPSTSSKNIAGSTIEIPTAPKSSSSAETSLSKSTNSLTSETSSTSSISSISKAIEAATKSIFKEILK